MWITSQFFTFWPRQFLLTQDCRHILHQKITIFFREVIGIFGKIKVGPDDRKIQLYNSSWWTIRKYKTNTCLYLFWYTITLFIWVIVLSWPNLWTSWLQCTLIHLLASFLNSKHFLLIPPFFRSSCTTQNTERNSTFQLRIHYQLNNWQHRRSSLCTTDSLFSEATTSILY